MRMELGMYPHVAAALILPYEHAQQHLEQQAHAYGSKSRTRSDPRARATLDSFLMTLDQASYAPDDPGHVQQLQHTVERVQEVCHHMGLSDLLVLWAIDGSCPALRARVRQAAEGVFLLTR